MDSGFARQQPKQKAFPTGTYSRISDSFGTRKGFWPPPHSLLRLAGAASASWQALPSFNFFPRLALAPCRSPARMPVSIKLRPGYRSPREEERLAALNTAAAMSAAPLTEPFDPGQAQPSSVESLRAAIARDEQWRLTIESNARSLTDLSMLAPAARRQSASTRFLAVSAAFGLGSVESPMTFSPGTGAASAW